MKTSKKLLALLLILVLSMTMFVACGSDEPADDPQQDVQEPVKITVATTGMTNPYSYLDEKEQLAGSEIELWKEIGNRTGYEIEFVTADFAGIMSNVDAKIADVASNCLGWTAERNEKYTLSEPYLYQGIYMVVREDDDSITEMADLVGKKVACAEDSTNKSIIDKYMEDNNLQGQIEYLITETGNFLVEVNLGRADVTFSQPVNFGKKMATGEYQLKMVGDPIYEEQAVFVFRKDMDPAVVDTINKTVAEMRADGYLSNLFTTVLGVDLSESAMK